VAVLTACGGPEQNALAPRGPQAHTIATLFWDMMIGAWCGLGIIVLLLVAGYLRRKRGFTGGGGEKPDEKPGEKSAFRVVIGLGIVLPFFILATVFVVGDVFVIKQTQAPARSATKLTVQVIGHQWFWEARYPASSYGPGGAVTANEIHIPVGVPVNLEVSTADVIHSFWVPQLNRKIDTIPGKINRIELLAQQAGRYRGECAEYCGLQHAHMSMYVYADPPAVFRKWLANEAKPARPPANAEQRRGLEEFLSGPCSSCHTIRGTSAKGNVGPDLTHVGSRHTLAALTIPNRTGYLAGWIVDSQHIKPGNQMPDINLKGPQLLALVAYLEHLK
jgi:cytochrome c oxidase subunit 2